jgi:hypothetical protein
MGDPVANAFVYAGLFVLGIILLQVLLAMAFGVSFFVLIRRWFRRRRPPGSN